MNGVPTSLPEQVISDITARLGQLDSLRLPGRLSRDNQPVSIDIKTQYLGNLLTHDPGVFLERHGELLIEKEITAFQAIRNSSYEVDFYLKLLEDKPKIANSVNSSNGNRRKGVLPLGPPAKNRRLARMQQLEQTGYFSEEAMRQREPYLYHLYIGQYAIDRTSDSMPGVRPENTNHSNGLNHVPADLKEGSKRKEPAASKDTEELLPSREGREAGQGSSSAALAGSILDRQDELELLLRREAEREAYAMQESEEESEEEEKERDKDTGVDRSQGMEEGGPAGEWPPPEDITEEQR